MGDLNMFSAPLSNVSSSSAKWIAYYPLTSLTTTSKTIEFVIRTNDQYVDFSNTICHLEGKFTKVAVKAEEGQNNKPWTCENSLLTTCIERIDVTVNDVLVTHSPFYYLTSHIYITMNANHVEQEYGLNGQLWKPAKPGEAEVIDPLIDNQKNRFDLVKDEATVILSGPLYTPLTQARKYLPPNLTIRIQLTLSPPELCVLENLDANDQHNFSITSARLEVRHITVPDRIRHFNEQKLLKENFVFTLPNYDIIVRSIPQGSSQAVLDNLPPIFDRGYLTFTKTTALVGQRNQSPFVFGHNNIRKCVLFRGSDIYTYDSLDFDKMKFGNSYIEMQRCLASTHVPLSRNRYKSDFAVIPFCVTACDPHLSLPGKQTGCTKILIDFSVATTDQISAIVLINRPLIMEIDSKRRVTVH